jgi:DNA-binding Lrp family transcriptional regulator
MLLRPPREWQQIMQQEPTDERDRAILRELMRDGRLTNVELAERVNLSPSACLRRVRAMEERGLIAGYVMLLDTARANMSGVAFVSVTLTNDTGQIRGGCPTLSGNRRMLFDRRSPRLRAEGRLFGMLRISSAFIRAS